jgi:hypothetical protein
MRTIGDGRGGQPLRPVHGLLIAWRPGAWSLLPARRSDPVPVALDTVLALARAARGARLVLAERELALLVDVGVLETARRDPVRQVRAQLGRDRLPDRPVSPSAVVHPIVGLVAGLTSRGLEVEVEHGRRLLLDDADIALLDALSDPDRTAEAKAVFAGARQALADVDPRIGPQRSLQPWSPKHDDVDLGRRLRRLTDAGRVRLFSDPTPRDVPTWSERATARATQAARRAGAASRDARHVLRHRAEDAKVHVRPLLRTPFPGREPLRKAYRRVRPAGPGPVPRSQPTEQEAPEPSDRPVPHLTVAPQPEVTAAVAAPRAPERYLADPAPPDASPDKVPVYAVFLPEIGPTLALGMLTASARQHDGGSLGERFEIRRPEDPASFLADLDARGGPAVLLCSNYVWSLERNLAIAQEAKARHPDLLVVHGGPSTPKYEGDEQAFFTDHGDVVDVTVRGEGEETLVAVLEALRPGLPALDRARLHEVAGIAFQTSPGATVVRNPDRERVADLDALPSPYLTGEFDHIHPSAWVACATFETNRGCPYGCTYCDWGSMTLSRVRSFDLDRVTAEMDWLGRHGVRTWMVADANVGIVARDVEVTRRMVETKARYGVPAILGLNVAKNTTKHLTAIFDHLIDAQIEPHATLALQSRDDQTLAAIHRENISTDHYLALAATFRRRLLPLQADILLGLPGQTLTSYTEDLQFLVEHEIPARIWITQLLPNSPMNDPEYRAEHEIVPGPHNVVLGTSTFSEADRAAMLRLRHAYTCFERYGLLRHVMRYLRWDHDVPCTDVMWAALRVSEEAPERYPLLNHVLRYWDHYPLTPFGWRSFYDEVRRFVGEELGVAPGPGLETVLRVQEALMPEQGRQLPDEVPLDHDYVAYHQAATRGLWIDGHATEAPRRLEDHPPATLPIYGDPLHHCGSGMHLAEKPREETVVDGEFWIAGHMELDSPLVVNFTDVAVHHLRGLPEQVPEDLPELVLPTRSNAVPDGARVSLGRRTASA